MAFAVLLPAQTKNIAYGKYLVEEVAKCYHSSISAQGYDLSKWLKGAELTFGPKAPMDDWRGLAPDLTTTGFNPDGKALLSTHACLQNETSRC